MDRELTVKEEGEVDEEEVTKISQQRSSYWT